MHSRSARYYRILLVLISLFTFAIPVQAARMLTIVSPNGGEWFEPGNVVQISWSVGGDSWQPSDTVKIEYNVFGGPWTHIQGANRIAYNAGSFSWDTSHRDNSFSYLIKVTFNGNATVYDVSDDGFGIVTDSTPPVILHSPLSYTTNTTGPYRVCAKVTDNRSMGTVTLYWRKNGGTFTSAPMPPTGNPDEYCADIPGPSVIGDQYCYFVEARDAALSANTRTDPLAGTSDPHCFNIGLCGTDVLGDYGGGGGGPGISHANAYSCATDSLLKEIQQYFIVDSPVELRFFVYEATAKTGTYTKIHETVIPNSGTGERWYSSGPISLPLIAGRYYIIGAGSPGYIHAQSVSWHQVSTAFGEFLGCWGTNIYPPPTTTTYSTCAEIHRQKLTSCRVPGTLQLIVPNGGEWFDPGSSLIDVAWGSQGGGWQTGDAVHVEYSANSGTTWTPVGPAAIPYFGALLDVNAGTLTESEHSRMRVVYNFDPSIWDMSDADFTVMPDTAPPAITHTPYPDTGVLHKAYTISCRVTDNFGVGPVYLVWRKNGGNWTSQLMSGPVANAYHSDIPRSEFIGDTIDYYIRAQDTSSAANVATSPDGAPGQVHTFDITACATDAIGSEGSLSATSRAGNLFQCMTESELTQIEQYIDLSPAQEIRFFVYESNSVSGTFTKIHETVVPTAGPGPGWYGSGPISVKLTYPKYYIIGAAWQWGSCYRDSSGHYSVMTAIGNSLYGYHGAAYPPPSTTTNTNDLPVYYQRLTSCRTARALTLTAPNGGQWCEPGNTVPITWTFKGVNWRGGDTVKLRYSTDSGSAWTDIIGAESLAYNTGTFNWDTTGALESDNYRVRVMCNADPAVSDMSDADFKIRLDTTPPVITHTPLTDTGILSGPYKVSAVISSDRMICAATLYWKKNGGELTAVPMTLVEGSYHADIPGPGRIDDRYCYYIEARTCAVGAGLGRSPAGAPDETYCFNIVPCIADVVGDTAYTLSTYSAGNVYYCSAESKVTEFQQYMNRAHGGDMAAYIYSSTSRTGTYVLNYSDTIPDPGTGEKWYSSGPVDFELTPGRYYLFGFLCPWNSEPFYFQTGVGNTPTAFGQWELGYDTVGSIQPTTNVIGTGARYYQRISSCRVRRSLEVHFPNGGYFIESGKTVAIQWHWKGVNWLPEDTLRIEYSTNSGVTWAQMPGAESVPYSAGSWSWNTTGFPESTEYRVKVIFNGDDSVFDMSDADFSVKTDVTAPTIAHTPLKDTHVPQTFYVYATVTDTETGVLNCMLYWRKNGAAWTPAAMTYSGGQYYAAIPGKTAMVGDVFEYYIEAHDKALVQNVGRSPATGYHTFRIQPVPDFFTQMFGRPPDQGPRRPDFNMDNLTIRFTPDGSYGYYSACVTPITSLPTDPTGGAQVVSSDNAYGVVTLAPGKKVSLYGVDYTRFYVSSNGRITFTYGVSSPYPSIYDHFYQPGISAFWCDLDATPTFGGKVSWKQLVDRVAVTYETIPERGRTNQNTFQVEMFNDGTIAISYLRMDSTPYLLVGLSGVNYQPTGLWQSDFSDYGPCCATTASGFSDTVLPADDGNLAFGILPVGQSLTEHATLTNTGNCDVWLGKLQLAYYAEDFNDGQAQGWVMDGSRWTVESRHLHGHRLNSADEISCLYGGKAFGDFYYQARIKCPQDLTDPIYLVFRASPDFSRYTGRGYLFGFTSFTGSGGAWYLLRQENGQRTGLGGGSSSAILPASNWNVLGVNVVGATAELFINGSRIVSIALSPATAVLPLFMSGRVGFDTRGGQVPYYETYYDDVIVEQAHPLGGGAGNPNVCDGFTLLYPPTLPTVLGPGQSLPLDLSYTPTAMGESSAMVRVLVTDPDGPLPGLELTGTGRSMASPVELKKLTDNTPVWLGGNIVSAVLPGRFYVQDYDRSSGIGVDWHGTRPLEGSCPDIDGSLITVDGERMILASAVQLASPGPEPLPLGISTRSVGGGNFKYVPGPIVSGQRGVTGCAGLNNIGLLVKTWGIASDVHGGDAPPWFMLSDGSCDPIKVECPMFTTLPTPGSYAAVTGTSSCYESDGNLLPKIRVRDQDDILPLAPPE